MQELSIIMPLYNAEKYLKESLFSIQKQTFKNYELICIDDGSTDNTINILKSFRKINSRMKILMNSYHSGAAISRNRGMLEACGKYIVFLDGDDIFDEAMLETIYKTAEEKSADIVIFEYKHVSTELINNKLQVCHGIDYISRYCKNVFSVQEYEPHEFIIWSLGLCNKIYKREFIQRNKLSFQELPSSNDVYFVCMALMLADRIIALEDNRVMLYARDHFEISRISCNRDSNCVYEAFMKIGQELIKRNIFDKLSECFYYKVFFYLKNALVADKNQDRAKNMYLFLQKQGINNICNLDRSCYEKADRCIHNCFNQFSEKSYETGWFKEDSAFEIYIYNMAGRVIDLIQKYSADNEKIAVWGAGKNGRIFLEFCRSNFLEIDFLIDSSEEKQGQMCIGYPVYSPEDIIDQIQVIIVSAFGIYEEVMTKVQNEKIKVIDLNQYLYLV